MIIWKENFLQPKQTEKEKKSLDKIKVASRIYFYKSKWQEIKNIRNSKIPGARYIFQFVSHNW